MILVDSSVWIDFLKDRQTLQVEHLIGLFTRSRIAIGDLMLVEVLQGLPSERAFADAQRIFATLPLIRISDERIAVTAARNYRLLRAKGVTVRKTTDTLIATRCILDDIPLLFSDRDFQPFVEHLGLRDAVELT